MKGLGNLGFLVSIEGLYGSGYDFKARVVNMFECRGEGIKRENEVREGTDFFFVVFF